MPTNFPSALDTLVNPGATDYLDTPAVQHDVQHANANDAIEALQAKVGVNGSGVTTTLDYLVKRSNVMVAPAANVTPLTLRAAASQTSDILRAENSAAAAVMRVLSDGTVRAPFFGNPIFGGPLLELNTTYARFTPGAASQSALDLNAYTGQSVDVFQVFDSTPTKGLGISANGTVTPRHRTSDLGTAAAHWLNFFAARGTFEADAAGSVPLTVKGAASQSAAILEVRSSSAALATFGTGAVTLAEGYNIAAGSTTGTKIGTATTQKLGFFNAAPIVRPAAITAPTGGVVIDAEARTAINAIRTALTNLGLTG